MIPHSPRLNKAIALAQKEARNLNHNYIGTEHILLGILREGGGLANDILKEHGIELKEVMDRVKPIAPKGMECDHCHQKAEVFLSQIVEGQMKQLNFCNKHWRIHEVVQHMEALQP